MNITSGQLAKQRYALPKAWRASIQRAASNVATPHVDYYLLLAVASRETNMRNIVGDGGHGRGMFQQDDRWQQDFLAHAQGCNPGTSTPRWDSALPKGRVPMVSAGAKRCATMLEAGVIEAARAGVPFGSRVRVAVAGYNCGMHNAILSWNNFHDPDRATTGGDYSEDVLERADTLRRM